MTRDFFFERIVMSEGYIERQLYLIRHGESRCNIEGYEPVSQDEKNDSVLSAAGEEQADKLGIYLADTDFAAVYSSGLKRAVMTADGILRHRDAPFYILPPLCEIGITPDYAGADIEELRSFCKNARFAVGYENVSSTVIPDETPGDFEERYFERAGEVLDYCAKNYTGGEKIALVSHAGFLTYIIFYILGYRDAQPRFDFRLRNTGITKITFYTPGTNSYGDIVFEYINDYSFLRQ